MQVHEAGITLAMLRGLLRQIKEDELSVPTTVNVVLEKATRHLRECLDELGKPLGPQAEPGNVEVEEDPEYIIQLWNALDTIIKDTEKGDVVFSLSMHTTLMKVRRVLTHIRAAQSLLTS